MFRKTVKMNHLFLLALTLAQLGTVILANHPEQVHLSMGSKLAFKLILIKLKRRFVSKIGDETEMVVTWVTKHHLEHHCYVKYGTFES